MIGYIAAASRKETKMPSEITDEVDMSCPVDKPKCCCEFNQVQYRDSKKNEKQRHNHSSIGSKEDWDDSDDTDPHHVIHLRKHDAEIHVIKRTSSIIEDEISPEVFVHDEASIPHLEVITKRRSEPLGDTIDSSHRQHEQFSKYFGSVHTYQIDESKYIHEFHDIANGGILSMCGIRQHTIICTIDGRCATQLNHSELVSHLQRVTVNHQGPLYLGLYVDEEKKKISMKIEVEVSKYDIKIKVWRKTIISDSNCQVEEDAIFCIKHHFPKIKDHKKATSRLKNKKTESFLSLKGKDGLCVRTDSGANENLSFFLKGWSGLDDDLNTLTFYTIKSYESRRYICISKEGTLTLEEETADEVRKMDDDLKDETIDRFYRNMFAVIPVNDTSGLKVIKPLYSNYKDYYLAVDQSHNVVLKKVLHPKEDDSVLFRQFDDFEKSMI